VIRAGTTLAAVGPHDEAELAGHLA
jgi:hypothetical protein